MNTFVTFNGIDRHTDLDRLEKIQRMFPCVEFGIILSEHWTENGNRYLDPKLLPELRSRNLNLSAHLCGSMAKQAIRDNWEPAKKFCNGYFDLFTRAQINIAGYSDNPETLDFFTIPDNLEEIIIQQKDYKCPLYREYNSRMKTKRVCCLIDASGGTGKEMNKNQLTSSALMMNDTIGPTGFAGGINLENAVSTVRLLSKACMKLWWIDMESSVRTDDWFDLDKVTAICGLVYGAMNMKPTSIKTIIQEET